MRFTHRIALGWIALVPLAGLASAQQERARGQERGGQETPAARPREQAPAEREARRQEPAPSPAQKNPRAVANEIAQLEALHRERMARINRLMEVYRESKNTERLKELEALRAAQVRRYENARERLKARVGASEFERIDNALKPGRELNPRAGERRNENANEANRAAAERQARERAEKERAEKARKDAEAREKREKNAREQQKQKDGGGQ